MDVQEDLSKIWDEDETPTEQLPVADPGTTAPVATPPENKPAETPAEPQIFEYVANGRTVKEPLDVILKRASQGYNYAQHVDQLRAQQEEIERKHQEALQIQQRWSQYDQYAKQNPEWAEHVRTAWESRQSGASQTGDSPSVPPAIMNELTTLKEQVQSISQFAESIKNQQADKAYYDQYNDVAKAYPDFDLQQSDPTTGKTLEYKVLEFARNNNIQNFKHAFQLFHHEQLIAGEKDRIRKEVVAELQKNRKAGVIAWQPGSSKPAQTTTDIRKMSEHDRLRAALEDKEIWGEN